MQAHRRQPANNVALAASTALAYAFISIASNFTTKLAGLLLPGAPDVVLTVQLGVMLAVMHAARAAGWVDWAPTTTARVYAFMPQSLTYGAHAALVLRALAMLNVPIYNTLKRMTPIIVLVAKVFLENKLPGLGIACSVVLTVLGCLVAGLGDLTFEIRSYMVALGAAGLQAMYILLTEYASPSGGSHTLGSTPRVISLSQFSPNIPSISTYSTSTASISNAVPLTPSKSGNAAADVKAMEGIVDGVSRQPGHTRSESGIGSALVIESPRFVAAGGGGWIPASLRPAMSVAAESMHYAAMTCLPIAAGMSIMTGQVQAAEVALQGRNSIAEAGGTLGGQAAWLVVVANMEWLLTGSLVVCTQANSALTTTVVGVLKGILAVVLGFFLLGGVGPQGMSWMGIIGITMNCAGGVWYAVVKWKESAASSIKPARN